MSYREAVSQHVRGRYRMCPFQQPCNRKAHSKLFQQLRKWTVYQRACGTAPLALYVSKGH